MSGFTDPLAVEALPDGLWRTLRAVSWEIGREGSGLTVTIPAGTITDLWTFPWWGRWVLNPTDARYAAAPLLHDLLYRDPAWDRMTADGIFYDAMRALGVARWRAVLIWAGVRVNDLMFARHGVRPG